MPYALVDDQLHSHPKFARAGLEAVGLWTLCLSHAAAYLTDGEIERYVAERYAGARLDEIAARLVAAGLWEPMANMANGVASGWLMHDYHDHNPSADEVRAKREAISEKRRAAGRNGASRRWHGKNGKPHSKVDGNEEANAVATPSQTDGPVPVPVPLLKEPSAIASGVSDPEPDTETSPAEPEPELPVNAKAFDVQTAAANGELTPELHAAAMRQKKLGKNRRPLYDAAVTGVAIRMRAQYIVRRCADSLESRRAVDQSCEAKDALLKRAAEQVLELGCTVERYLDVAWETRGPKYAYAPLNHIGSSPMPEKVRAWIPVDEREPTGAAAREAAAAKAAYAQQQEAFAAAKNLFAGSDLKPLADIPDDPFEDPPFELDDDEEMT